MPFAAAIPGILAGVSSGFQAIGGATQLEKDKDELNRLAPAFYKIQDEYYDNYNQAAQMAGQGLTANAKDYYGDMAGRGLGTAVSGTLQAGGSVNDISKIFDSYNNSIRTLGVQDSEAQIGNIKYFQQVGKDLAGQKTQQWVINEYAPYQNKLKELTKRIEADKQNIWKGVSGVIGGAATSVSAIQNEKLLNDLFKGVDQVGSVANVAEAAGSAVSGITEGLNVPDPYQTSGLGSMMYNDKTGTNIPGLINTIKQVFAGQDRPPIDENQIAEILDIISSANKPKE